MSNMKSHNVPFYAVACPACGAPIGRACWQMSILRNTGERRTGLPHVARKKAANVPAGRQRLIDSGQAETIRQAVLDDQRAALARVLPTTAGPASEARDGAPPSTGEHPPTGKETR